MGLSERKNKQKIGDDPRNTRWAKNQSNPGFKILSSMGWTPSTTRLGAGCTTNTQEPIRSSWKRLPGSTLPVIKSTTSGLGANPNQTSSNSYLLGAPRFVPASLSITNQLENPPIDSLHQDDPDRSSKISIVTNGGGGFDDLLSRLNNKNKIQQQQQQQQEEEKVDVKLKSTIQEKEKKNDLTGNDSFVLVSLEGGEEETTKQIDPNQNQDNNNDGNNDNKPKEKKLRSIINLNKSKQPINKVRKRVRILEFCKDLEKEEEGIPKRKKMKINHTSKNKSSSSFSSPFIVLPPKNYNDDEIIIQNKIKNPIIKRKDINNSKINKRSSCSLISNLTHLKKPEEEEKEKEPTLKKEEENKQEEETTTTTSVKLNNSSIPLVISRPINPRVASRAKYIKSKKLASSQNSIAMAEILGIPPPRSIIQT